MGFFSSPGDLYSPKEQCLSEVDVRKLVSTEHAHSLDEAQVKLIEDAVIARRLGDGLISLRQIYETLEGLMNSYKISKIDRDAAMKLFVTHFDTHHKD